VLSVAAAIGLHVDFCQEQLLLDVADAGKLGSGDACCGEDAAFDHLEIRCEARQNVDIQAVRADFLAC